MDLILKNISVCKYNAATSCSGITPRKNSVGSWVNKSRIGAHSCYISYLLQHMQSMNPNIINVSLYSHPLHFIKSVDTIHQPAPTSRNQVYKSGQPFMTITLYWVWSFHVIERAGQWSAIHSLPKLQWNLLNYEHNRVVWFWNPLWSVSQPKVTNEKTRDLFYMYTLY